MELWIKLIAGTIVVCVVVLIGAAVKKGNEAERKRRAGDGQP